MTEPNARPFREVLERLLLDRPEYVTPLNAPNWSHLSKQVMPAVSYESLRKAVAGDRAPSVKIMEAVAKALDVEPNVFREYRLELARQMLDPREVGDERAYANLARLERAGLLKQS